jgi:hypothetical protein
MKDKIITLLLTLAFSALILMLWPVLACAGVHFQDRGQG